MCKKLFLLLFLFFMMQFGCVSGPQNESGEAQAVINNSNCVGCHGPEQEQNEPVLPSKELAEKNETGEENKTEAGQETAGPETKINDSAENLQESGQNASQQNETAGEKKCEGPAQADIFSASSVRYGGEIYDDQCVQWNTVKKYYCKNDGSAGNSNFNCPAGYWCMHGACVEFVGSCTDSDGNNTAARGYVSVVSAPLASQMKYDKCEDEGMVREWVCSEEEGIELLLECGSGFKCANGRCVKSGCAETDGGFEPMIFGETTVNDETFYDRCVDDEILREYYCYGDGIRHKDVKCADRCIDDSCMPME